MAQRTGSALPLPCSSWQLGNKSDSVECGSGKFMIHEGWPHCCSPTKTLDKFVFLKTVMDSRGKTPQAVAMHYSPSLVWSHTWPQYSFLLLKPLLKSWSTHLASVAIFYKMYERDKVLRIWWLCDWKPTMINSTIWQESGQGFGNHSGSYLWWLEWVVGGEVDCEKENSSLIRTITLT